MFCACGTSIGDNLPPMRTRFAQINSFGDRRFLAAAFFVIFIYVYVHILPPLLHPLSLFVGLRYSLVLAHVQNLLTVIENGRHTAIDLLSEFAFLMCAHN